MISRLSTSVLRRFRYSTRSGATISPVAALPTVRKLLAKKTHARMPDCISIASLHATGEQARWDLWAISAFATSLAVLATRNSAHADDGESTPPWAHVPRPGLTWSALVGALTEVQESLSRAAGFSAQRRRCARSPIGNASADEAVDNQVSQMPMWEYTLEFSAAPEANMFDLFSSLVNAFCGPGQARVSSQERATRTTLHAIRDNDFELTVIVPRHGGVDRRVILEVLRTEADAKFSANEVAALMHAYEISQNGTTEAGPEVSIKTHGYLGAYEQPESSLSRGHLRGNDVDTGRNKAFSRETGLQIESAKRKLEELGAEVFVPKDALTWDMLAGYDDVKNVIDESIILPLRHPEVYNNIVRGTREQFESVLPRAILLTGRPGVGKTTIAKILASAVGVPFVNLRLESFLSKYYGETTRKMSEILETTKRLGPCLVFCDEIDALGSSREAPDAHEVTRRTLSVLLRHLDGLEGPQESILVAATNLPGMLDTALMSRFDVVIALDLPDAATRSAILKRYAKQLTNVERDALAEVAVGFSGRELRDACEGAERAHAGRVVRAAANDSGNNELQQLAETYGGMDGELQKQNLPVFEDYLAAIQRKAKTSIGRRRENGPAEDVSRGRPIAV